jgi:pSer/pThr/pTyr-binding forkhead associated (FHA) protein
MPKLSLKLNHGLINEYPLQKGVSLTIGRRDDNDVVIKDPAVSGHHARIDFLGERLVLTDLKSKNGSFVNEQLVHSHWLKDADTITIGEHSLVLNFESREQTPTDASRDLDETRAMNTTQHRRMIAKSNPTKSINNVRFWDQSQNSGTVRDVEPPAGGPSVEDPATEPAAFLSYLDGGAGQIKLTRKLTTIGTDPSSDIVIKGLLMDPTAATISRTPGGFSFNYVGGLPRPKINDAPVKEPALLAAADIIQIGSARLQFGIEEEWVEEE